jgi:hypothetical protein
MTTCVQDGQHKDGYDKDGYDKLGFSKSGLNRCGYHMANNWLFPTQHVSAVFAQASKRVHMRKAMQLWLALFLHHNLCTTRLVIALPRTSCALLAQWLCLSCILLVHREGYNRQGEHKDGYDHAGYDKFGYNREGLNKDGYDR